MPISDLSLKETAISEKAWTVGGLYGKYKSGLLTFNTEYQRSEVWPKPKKQLLIDSMLRKYDISMIFLRQNDNGVYECLDGQQRLKSIFEFMNGAFPIVPKITEELDAAMHYSDLPDGLQSRIREFIMHSLIVHNTSDEVTSDIFLRLQEGMPLNSPEKLNAMQGYMRKRVIQISHRPFFSGIGLADTRFGHRYLAAQMLALALANNFVNLKFWTLKKYYITYKSTDVPHQALDRVKGALKLLNKALIKHKSTVRYRADVVSLYSLADIIRKNYSITGIEKKLGDFILDFLVKVEVSEKYPSKIGYTRYARYANLRSSSADSGPNVKERHEIILTKFLQRTPDIQPKDPTRAFNYAERLAIYYRASGKCEECKKQTPFKKGHAHHKVRHTDGGKTIVKNGQWLCEKCHLSVAHSSK